MAEIAATIPLAAFVEAFYTTGIFKLERLVLAHLASHPSTDLEARQLAQGTLAKFAAWSVEARSADQLLLADTTGRTRSWLMVATAQAVAPSTRLYFGSAVLPVRSPTSGRARLGFGFSALLGFHKLYSRALLSAARARLLR
jgi:hypothetical protein